MSSSGDSTADHVTLTTPERAAVGGVEEAPTGDAASQPSPVAAPRGTDASARVSQRPQASAPNEPVDWDLDEAGAPTPIADRTRQLLRPLLGFDPAEASVFQGALPAQMAHAAQADGLTIGGDIVLGAGSADRSPSSVGVQAHELAHVGWNLRRFIPPIVPPAYATRAEAVAEYVEGAAIAAAHTADRQAWAVPTELPAAMPERAAPADVVARGRRSQVVTGAQPSIGAPHLGGLVAPPPDAGMDAASAQPSAPAPDTVARQRWGNLPAPWEPLPAASQAPRTAAAPASIAAPAPPVPPVVDAPTIQRAAAERSLVARVAPAVSPTPAAEPASAPAPDLDAIALQVYGILKQRLAAERRRSER